MRKINIKYVAIIAVVVCMLVLNITSRKISAKTITCSGDTSITCVEGPNVTFYGEKKDVTTESSDDTNDEL